MKFKTYLAAILVILAILATMLPAGAATFADTRGTRYESAAEQLAALGITRGLTPTSFGPNEFVTRAQMVVFVIRTLAREQEALAQTGPTAFSDVPASHWASGYINVAVSRGIITGHGGRFRPDDRVTFAEAATMIVRALGFTDTAIAALGVWPTGHIAKAQSLGLLQGVVFDRNAWASRGEIALLLWNTVLAGGTLAVTPPAEPGSGPVAAVEVTPATAHPAIGELLQFTATARDVQGRVIPGVKFLWSATGPGVIGQDGRFIAYGSGECTIRATAGDVTGLARAAIAGAPTALKLAAGAAALTANAVTTLDLTVQVVDVAGTPVATGTQSVNLVISGDARFLDGTTKVQTLVVSTIWGSANVRVVGADGVYRDSTAQVTATSPAGLTGAILTLGLIKPTVSGVSLTPAAGVIEARAGSAVAITAQVLDLHGVTVPAQADFTLDLSVSDEALGAVGDVVFDGSSANPDKTKDATFTAKSRPGTVTITGVARHPVTGAELGLTVTACTITTAIAGDPYRLAMRPVAPMTAGTARTVQVEVRDYNGVVKTSYAGTLPQLRASHPTAGQVTVNAQGVENGVISYDLSLTKAGEWALATVGTTLQQAAGAVSVGPAAAAAVRMSRPEPMVLVANGSHQSKLTAEIIDAYGNLVPAAGHQVTFERLSSLGGTAATTLPSTMTAGAVGGKASIYVTATTNVSVDTFRAHVTPGTGAVWYSCVEYVETRIVGLPHQLGVVMGEPVAAGQGYTVEVKVQDCLGNHVSTDQGRPVTLTLEQGTVTGAALASSTATTVNGTATFTVTSTKVGDVHVKALSGGLTGTGAQTGAFVAGPPVQVFIASDRESIETNAIGSTGSCALLQGKVVDAYGNEVTAGGSLSGLTFAVPAGGLGYVDEVQCGVFALVSGTAAGTTQVVDAGDSNPGKATWTPATGSAVELPVVPTTVTFYNAGPAHRWVIRPIAATVVSAPGCQAGGMLIAVELQDSEGRLKTSISGHEAGLAWTGPTQNLDIWRLTDSGWGRGCGEDRYVSLTLRGLAQFYLTNERAGTLSFTADSRPNCVLPVLRATAQGTFLPGPASTVAYSVNPGAIRADGSSVSALTCAVADAFGNTVSGVTGTMHWAIDAGAGFGSLLFASTPISNGLSYNTLQAKARDIAGDVVLKAWTTLPGATAPTYTEVTPSLFKVQVDGQRPVISGVGHTPEPYCPAAGDLTINYTLSEAARVWVRVYNQAGALVATPLSAEPEAAGPNTVSWNGQPGGTAVPAGTYTYRLDATDAAGNQAVQMSGIVTVVDLPPLLTGWEVDPVLFSDTTDFWVGLSRSATMTVNLYSDSTRTTLFRSVSGSVTANGYPPPAYAGNAEWNGYDSESEECPDGTYWFRITVSDGIMTETVEGTVAKDTVAPGLTGVGASPNPFADYTTISYTLSEDSYVTVAIYDGPDRVRILFSEASQLAGSRTVVWYGDDDGGEPLPDGGYACIVTARDLAGNVVSDDTLILVIDRTVPVVSGIYADPDPFRTTTTINYTLAEHAMSVTVDIYSEEERAHLVKSLPGSQTQATWDGTDSAGTPVVDGVYYFTITAVDPAGNAGIGQGTLIKDTTAPTVTVIGASPDPFRTSTTVSYTLDEECQSVRVRFYSDSSRSVLVQTVSGTQASATWNGTDTGGAAVGSGTYYYTVRARDYAGNQGTGTGEVTVDRTAPVISDVSASPDPFADTTTISYTLSETASVTVNIYSEEERTHLVESLPGSQTQATWNGTDSENDPVVDGVYYFTITAVDAVGNEAVPVSGTVALDTNGPQVTNIAATPNPFSSATTISYTLSETAASVTVDIYRDSARTDLVKSLAGSQTQAVWHGTDESGTAVGSGTYYFIITATDVLGNTGTGQGTVTADRTAPVVSNVVATPAAFNPDLGSTTITYSIADASPYSVTVEIRDGATVIRTLTGGASSAVWDGRKDNGSKAQDKTYAAVVIATDAFGQTGHGIGAVTIDKTDPNITGLTCSPINYKPAAGSLTISYGVNESVRATVTIQRKVSGSWQHYLTLLEGVGQTSGAQTVIWDGKDGTGAYAPAGDYRVRVDVFDLAGNSDDNDKTFKVVD